MTLPSPINLGADAASVAAVDGCHHPLSGQCSPVRTAGCSAEAGGEGKVRRRFIKTPGMRGRGL
ncbi:hypothetical protein ARTHRO9AX_220058 [Arthrobacter sp. 9AX]|nr:hypothetical protein ARTHRO9AX_220058 [Arthrobacter sp. 9AX]